MYQKNEYYERYGKWVMVSFRMVRADKDRAIPSRVQGLGIIDAELYYIKKEDLLHPNGKLKVDENDIPYMDEINIKSYLWVLGVYELFRAFDQRLREDSSLATDEAILAVKGAKDSFARLRVPLAKLEPSKKYKGVDWDISKIGVYEDALAWKLNDNLIFRYTKLSDYALDVMRMIWPRGSPMAKTSKKP
ncbi:MAG TPA: hypothetical protein VN922_13135 [Bacteroidia bacterium]|nr:hypothetical protein [Bacteroidia bacterium]